MGGGRILNKENCLTWQTWIHFLLVSQLSLKYHLKFCVRKVFLKYSEILRHSLKWMYIRMDLFLEVNFISSEVLLTVLQGATFLWQYLATFFFQQQRIRLKHGIMFFSKTDLVDPDVRFYSGIKIWCKRKRTITGRSRQEVCFLFVSFHRKTDIQSRNIENQGQGYFQRCTADFFFYS